MINSITLGHRSSRVRNLFAYSIEHRLLVVFILIIGVVLVSSFKFKDKILQSRSAIQTVETKEDNVGVYKEFSFAIYDNEAKKTGNSLKITLTEAERTNKILVNGQQASVRDGKDFLVLYMEINNPTDDKLNVRPVDFFRLIDGNGNSYAADVHNDPVKAEPISIKKTRIGYVVDESQTNFKFLVGEINGEKQEIEINI